MKTFDEQINSFLVDKFLVNEADISDDARFLVELEFDLEEIVQFIREVQTKFQVNIPLYDIKHVLTIGGMKKYIKQKLEIHNYDYNN